MKDFVRVIPKKGFENWSEKLTKMGSLFHVAEYQTVKEEIRDAATLHVDQNNLQEIMGRLNRDELKFTPLRKSGYYQGFAHSHKAVESGDPFYWYGCLTRTQKDADIFKKADLAGDHNTIGRMLGFPECCRKYFSASFPNISYDPVWVGREGELSGFPECNNMLRYFGARITSHLSCSPTCQKTKEIGKIWFEIMKKKDVKLAEELYGLLAGEMTWNSYHDVAQVDTPYFLGLTHTFVYVEKPRIIHWQKSVQQNIKKNQGKDKKVDEN